MSFSAFQDKFLENCDNGIEMVDKMLRYLDVVERVISQALLSEGVRKRDQEILDSCGMSLNMANVGHTLQTFRNYQQVYKEQDQRFFIVDDPLTASLPQFTPRIVCGTLEPAFEQEKACSLFSCEHGIGLCQECGVERAISSTRRERQNLRSLREDLLRQKRYLLSL